MRVTHLLIAPAIFACSADVSGHLPTETSSEALVTEVVAPTDESVGKAAHQDVIASVAWDEVARHESVSSEQLPQAAARAAAEAPIPTLVPSDPELLGSSMVFTGPDWVASQHEGPGFFVEIFGTRRAFSYPHIEVHELERVVEGRPLITRSEGVPYLSFTRFGVAYRISVECVAGPQDLRCAEFDTVTELFDSLVVVNGGQR
jgi:hypothetical protein